MEHIILRLFSDPHWRHFRPYQTVPTTQPNLPDSYRAATPDRHVHVERRSHSQNWPQSERSKMNITVRNSTSSVPQWSKSHGDDGIRCRRSRSSPRKSWLGDGNAHRITLGKQGASSAPPRDQEHSGLQEARVLSGKAQNHGPLPPSQSHGRRDPGRVLSALEVKSEASES